MEERRLARTGIRREAPLQRMLCEMDGQGEKKEERFEIRKGVNLKSNQDGGWKKRAGHRALIQAGTETGKGVYNKEERVEVSAGVRR